MTIQKVSNAMLSESVGKFVQHAVVRSSALTSVTATISLDDNPPEITQGTEILSLNFTPTSATNKLLIKANVFGSPSSSAIPMTAAMFIAGTTNALTAGADGAAGSGYNVPCNIPLFHEMTAGTTSQITISIRAGVNGGGATFFINGTDNGDSRVYGTTPKCYLEIIEVEP